MAKKYSEVLGELEDVVDRMNRGEVAIDELGTTVKSAAKMIKFLKDKLKSTEVEINQILMDLEDED